MNLSLELKEEGEWPVSLEKTYDHLTKNGIWDLQNVPNQRLQENQGLVVQVTTRDTDANTDTIFYTISDGDCYVRAEIR